MKRYYIYGFSFIFFLFVSIVLWGCMCNSKNRLEKCYVKKEHTIKSEYSENQRIYSQVYCEDEFDFKKAGSITGSFILPLSTDFDALCFEVLIPNFFWGSVNYDDKWMANIKLPVNVIFEWKDNNDIKQIAKTTVTQNGDETSCGSIGIQYVPLPRNKKIDYTLIFEAGSFCEGYLCKGLEYGKGAKKIDKTTDINEHPENYPSEFWKAKFMIVEIKRKGDINEKKYHIIKYVYIFTLGFICKKDPASGNSIDNS